MRNWILLWIGISLLTGCGGAGGSDTQVSANPPPAVTPPSAELPTDTEAARFLLQTSYGPTPQAIEAVTRAGYAQWIDEQFERPVNFHLPLLNQTFSGTELYPQHWVETWWQQSVRADDQLRQRVAFALSEIFVISTHNTRISGDPRGVASYYDTLLQHSFGNFRELLEAVTLHPMMGMYLSMLGNEKPDVERNIRPDENFAREVMQLFTIGLVELNLDGTRRLNANGETVPTYDQSVIKGFAHVFTGWNFAGRSHWWEDTYDGQTPMQAYEDFHAQGEKALLNGTVLPAGQDAYTDLSAALDNLFYHHNVAPFIAKQLIQRLVMSNPSPAFIERVARQFNDNGSGVRGDMQAVIRAILLDEEARSAQTEQGGKLRNPLLRLAHIMRVFNSRARDGGMGHEFINYDIGLSPLGAPSVFNFYRPDYSLPGVIRNTGLVAPEFQITNEISVTRFMNHVFYMAQFNNLRGNEIVEDNVGILNFDALAALSDDPQALVDYLDLMLLAGSMDDLMRATLLDVIAYWQERQDTPEWVMMATLVYLTGVSPQFAVQY